MRIITFHLPERPFAHPQEVQEAFVSNRMDSFVAGNRQRLSLSFLSWLADLARGDPGTERVVAAL